MDRVKLEALEFFDKTSELHAIIETSQMCQPLRQDVRTSGAYRNEPKAPAPLKWGLWPSKSVIGPTWEIIGQG
jgi:hypothetical protein